MNGFSPEQLQQLKSIVQEAVREELNDAGLRIDGAEHQDEAREDFRFLRRIRRRVDSASSAVGMAVILAVASGFIWLITQGVNVWKGH